MKKTNFSLYGLPSKIKFCKKCVNSNQRPMSVVEFKNTNDLKNGLKFDKNICSFINYWSNFLFCGENPTTIATTRNTERCYG